MTDLVSYEDISRAMNRSPSVVKSWASLSRPKSMPWTNVRLGEGKQPTRYYPIEDVIIWLARSYAHFDSTVETKLREIAKKNPEVCADA